MQTTMTQFPARGQAGQLYHPPPAGGIVTKFTEGALVVPGIAVVAGTLVDDVAPPAADFTSNFVGVPLFKESRVAGAIAAKVQLGVLREGFVLVAYEPDTAPTPNTQAYARHTANGAGKLVLGAFRADADTDNASPVPGGMFRDVFTSEGLVVLELSGHVQFSVLEVEAEG